MLGVLSFALNYPAKHLSAEDMQVQCISDASHYKHDLKASHADLVLLDLNIGNINGQDIVNS